MWKEQKTAEINEIFLLFWHANSLGLSELKEQQPFGTSDIHDKHASRERERERERGRDDERARAKTR